MKTRIIIPQKSLRESKSSFSEVFTEVQRQNFVVSMLRDMINACSQVEGVDLAVVSPDEEILNLFEEEGFAAISEPDIGLNRALDLAISRSVDSGFGEILIFPGDLPLLKKNDVEGILELASGEKSVIITPSKEGGTNALLLRPPDLMDLYFGGKSFTDHMKEAKRRGVLPKVYRSERVERDMDKPADLLKLETLGKGTRTHSFFRFLKK